MPTVMKHQQRLFIVIAFLLTTLISGCTRKPHPSHTRLVLFLTIDQLRADYLKRFRGLFKGGLKYLLENGTAFPNVYYEHADTATCPGHATLVSGVHPSRSGIVSNWWYDRASGQPEYCVADTQYGRSPKNLLVSTLPDWVDRHSMWNEVYAISGKDRSAILLGGKRADGVFWYDKDTGEMVTSEYYSNDLGNLRDEFHSKRLLLKHFGTPWNPLQQTVSRASTLQISEPNEGDFPETFPHIIGGAELTPSRSFYSGIYSTPFVDEYIAQFAKAVVENRDLGGDSRVDYLGISFSALDTIGHRYGPNSKEVLDTLLRLDRTLADLFSFLDKRVGLKHILIAVTSDHGAQPFPEYEHTHGRDAHRQNAEDVACIQAAGKAVATKHKSPDLFRYDLYLNHSLIEEKKLSQSDIVQDVVKELGKCKMIEKVWTVDELLSEEETANMFQEQFQKSFHQGRSGDFLIQLKYRHLHSLIRGTGHGSPYEYDTHVPILLFGPGIPVTTVTERISNVDIAPTVASLLGIPYPRDLDGVSREKLLN